MAGLGHYELGHHQRPHHLNHVENRHIEPAMVLKAAFQTAIGTSLISMIAMETAMNLVDFWVTGGAKLTLTVLPLMWQPDF